MLPFTPAQFFAVFGAYNVAIWPAQIVAYGLAIVAVAALMRPGAAADRIVCTILAAMWIFTGAAYHWLHFAAINRAALAFGLAFVGQGAVFLVAGTVLNRIRFAAGRTVRAAVGAAFILYAAVLYPLLGAAFGHVYPDAPTFGVTPCPLTIFTFGCLLLVGTPVRWWMLAIPVLWSLVGGSAAFLLGVPQDWMLLASGAATVALLATARPPLVG